MLIGLMAASDNIQISTVGLNPYGKVDGNPVVALIAQLNRFAGKAFDEPGCSPPSTFLKTPLPLVAVLDRQTASVANVIVTHSVSCVSDATLVDFKEVRLLKEAWLRDPIGWVTSDLTGITVRIAQYADSLGLALATAGITKRDPNIKPPPAFPVGLVFLGLIAIGGAVFAWRTR